MRIEHVIYLSSAGCSLWSWCRTQFDESTVRTPVGADPGPLVEELARLEAAPIAVLVDMTDEEHTRDTVLRLGSRDQQAMLARKLARAFPRTPFRAAQVQGRNAENPDEDCALLSALTRPEPVRFLMQRLADARLPVVGVFSPALLTERLLDPQACAAPALMLVLRRGNGRLQHSFFRDGRLAGSRRLRATATPALEDPSFMLRQLEESLRYFDPTFAASADRPLQVLLAPADLELLSSAEGRGEGWQLRPLEVAELGKRLRIRAGLGDGVSERVFVELLRQHAGTTNFAPPADRRYFEFFRIRFYARAACLALAGAAFIGTLVNGLAIFDAGQRAAGSSATVHQLETLLPGVPESGSSRVDPMEMQMVVTAYDALAGHQAEPGYVLVAIGAAVSQRPGIQVDALEWSAERPAVAATEQGSEDGEATAPAPPAGITVILKGHVAPFGGDYARAFDELQAFVDALRETPDIDTVTPRAQPLDVSPSSTLTGEVAVGTPPGDAAFTLEIVMRLPHERA